LKIDSIFSLIYQQLKFKNQ